MDNQLLIYSMLDLLNRACFFELLFDCYRVNKSLLNDFVNGRYYSEILYSLFLNLVLLEY